MPPPVDALRLLCHHARMSFIETVSQKSATGELAELYEKIAGPNGRMDNVLLVQSLNARALRIHHELWKSANHDPDSPLDRGERELVAVVVSRLNGCHYCVTHHVRNLKRIWPEDRHYAVDHLASGKITRLSEREEAIVRYATKLTMNARDIERADIDELRAHDLDDRAIHDLAHLVGYYNYVNRIVLGLGVQLED